MKFKSNENGPLTITFDCDYVRTTHELPWDANADDIVNAFVASCISLTFEHESIINAMRECVETYDALHRNDCVAHYSLETSCCCDDDDDNANEINEMLSLQNDDNVYTITSTNGNVTL